MSALPEGYPRHRAVDVVLRDGSTIHIRPVVPDDAPAVVELFARVSTESSALRFHGLRRLSGSEAQRFTDVDYRERFGLVAEVSGHSEGSLLALANYVSASPGKAEVAFLVDDAWHGRGVGSVLLEHLGEAAADAGITAFEADVLAHNKDMLDVIRNTGLPIERTIESGVVHLEFPTGLTDEALDAFERREAIAAAAGVAALLEPRSVAVIGASRSRGTIGGEVFRNLLDGDFAGPVYPVNPKAEVVQSVRAYPSISEVPGPVDLAVIVVPAALVLDVARECGRKGVRGLLIISSGFGEVSEAGRALQAELVAIARGYGMRIIGPNCMGAMNTDESIRLNASFAPFAPAPGRLAFSSQSGALGIAIIGRTLELGLGMSSFVSVGNKADISGNDLLQYWEQDPNTDVILLYLESFGNPRKFARIARRVAREKPVVAVKSGRSTAGARAAASHTGSLAAGDVAVDALFRQAGVIRTDTLQELFDVASLLAHQPMPAGTRVGILTNAGGLGILCADACESAGLTVPELAESTASELRSLLPAEASVGNPVDMIASATPEQYASALELLTQDPAIDSVIVIFIPPLVTKPEDVARAISGAAEATQGKTILACFLGVTGIHEQLRSEGCVIPSFAFPEDAARALARVANHSAWRAKPTGVIPDLEDIDKPATTALGASLLEGGKRWLEPDAVAGLLDAYGIRSARSRTVASADDVEKAAEEIGRPVVLKIVSRTIVHKTDVGGVRLDLTTPQEASRAAHEMMDELARCDLADQIDGILVMEMVKDKGAEMFVGVTHDPSFGPIIACGAGGTLVELVRDVSVRITPLTDVDADEMLRSLKTYPLLEGYRGSPELDKKALEELLLRVSAMVQDLPQIAELDLNPVLVLPTGRGCVVLDSRIKIGARAPEAPRGARRNP